MARILVVDDDADFGKALERALDEHGYDVKYVERAQGGAELLSSERFDVVLLDNRMPGMTGIEFLRVLKDRRIHLPVILMTKLGTSDTAIEAINLGAFDYVEKPLELDELMDEVVPLIEKALTIIRSPRPPPRLGREKEHQMLGNSKPMLELYKQIGKAGKSDLPVLIQGETGAGKELVARAVHRFSSRRDRPFVALNCAALSDNLLEDELFGHEAGAFTGADKLRKGRFEYADSGTLFLDEIGDMLEHVQVKLLRVLEYQEVERLGSNESIRVDVRIISATHRDLETDAREGRFREDLLYRLNGHPLRVPPLRERGSDLRTLGRHFRIVEAAKANRPAPSLHESSLKLLRDYHWPGNVRELQYVMRRAVRNCRGAEIMPEDIGLPVRPESGPTEGREQQAQASLREAVRSVWETSQGDVWPTLRDGLECELLRHALAELDGNQTKVAERLGVSRNYLRKRVHECGLE